MNTARSSPISREGLADGELGGSVTYLYWSERRIQRLLSDNGIRTSTGTTKITSPSINGLVPTLEYTSNTSSHLRANVAATVERSLGMAIMSNFSSEAGARYAAGTGSLVFGEFIHDFKEHLQGVNRRSLAFTCCDYDDADKDSVAISLFGSMDNFADYIQNSGTPSENGWTSSAAPSIIQFSQECGATLSPSRA